MQIEDFKTKVTVLLANGTKYGHAVLCHLKAHQCGEEIAEGPNRVNMKLTSVGFDEEGRIDIIWEDYWRGEVHDSYHMSYDIESFWDDESTQETIDGFINHAVYKRESVKKMEEKRKEQDRLAREQEEKQQLARLLAKHGVPA